MAWCSFRLPPPTISRRFFSVHINLPQNELRLTECHSDLTPFSPWHRLSTASQLAGLRVLDIAVRKRLLEPFDSIVGNTRAAEFDRLQGLKLGDLVDDRIGVSRAI